MKLLPCLLELVSLPSICDDVDTSAACFFAHELTGINIPTADKLADNSYLTGIEFLQDKLNSAIRIVQAKAIKKLKRTFDFIDIISSQEWGCLSSDTISAGEGYHGFCLTLKGDENIETCLSGIQFTPVGEYTGDVLVKDLNTGKEVYRQTYTGSGCIDVDDIVIENGKKSRELFVGIERTSELYVYSQHCDKKGCTQTCTCSTYIRTGVCIDNDFTLEYGNSFCFLLERKCKLENVLCDYADELSYPIWAKFAELVYESYTYSDRQNFKARCSQEEFEQLQLKYRDEYLGCMENLFEGFTPKGACFECKPISKNAIQIW